MGVRILIYDDDLTHANNIITAISSGYGSNIASQCEIITTDPFTRAYTDSNIIAIIRSYAGWLNYEDTAKLTYNLTNYRVQTFFTTGLNEPQELFVCPTSADLPFIVLAGGGTTTNQTAYSVEFFDSYSVLSSYANGAILGKILKIKDTLVCGWWQARYRARVTASKSNVYDDVNGFGIINTTNAISYSGSIITDPYILGDTAMANVIQLRNPISKTYAEMLALILASGLKTGQSYYISDKAIVITAISTTALDPYVIYLTDTANMYHYNIATDTLTSLPTTTELGYVKGVTSAIQTQIDTKISTANWGEPQGGYLFDGVNDYVTSANTQKTKGFSVWIYPAVTNKAILNFGTNMQVTFNSSNVIQYGSTFANVTTYVNGVASTTLTLNKWNHIVSTFDEITPTVLEMGRYSTTYLTGAFLMFRQFNRALTSTDATVLYGNGLVNLALKYEDVRASSTEVISNGTFDTDTYWSKSANATITGGKGVITNGANENGIYKSGILIAGKRYKVTYEISDYTSGSVLFLSGTYTKTRTANGSYSEEFVASAASNGLSIYFYASGANNNWKVDNVTCISLGCVAEYLPQNAGSIGWIETQNMLTGQTSGSPINVNIDQRPLIYRDVKLAIANTATTLTGIVPKGYQIYAIRGLGTASLTGVSIGTSSGGTQVVNADTASTTAKILTLAGNVYNETADTTLYAQHATAGQTLDLTFVFEKISR